MTNQKANRPKGTEADWENRILCSDETCIGVIGPDGRCKECGLPYKGQLPAGFGRPAQDGLEEAPDESPVDETPPQEEEPEPTQGDTADDADWENRKLCSDETCIGIIGPDGRCKECGRPFEG